MAQTSQAVLKAAVKGNGAQRAMQANMQAAVTAGGKATVGVASAAMMVAYTPPATRGIRNSQATTQASVTSDGNATTKTSAAVMLIAYRTGSIENLNLRSWTYSLDGHTFYCLTLGEQGTFVYDEITDEWAQFQTAGLSSWNMEIGTTWKGKILAADQANPTIWEMDPTSFIDDDYKTMTRVVTGALSMRNRAYIPNYAFRITASLGEPVVANTIPATEPTVTLEVSDDQGKTFVSMGDVIITSDDFVQELAWLSLGTMRPPQRVFRVTDVGAIARIDGADGEVGEEGS